MRCKATSKRSGKQCKKDAVVGREVCHIHGGKSAVGAGHPNYKDGTHSKYAAVFSGEALEHYERAVDDPRYIELKNEIALFDALIIQELMEAKLGQGGALWEELGEVWTRFQEAQPAKDATTAGRCLRRMGEIIGEGVGRHAAQSQAVDLVERKRKLTDTERRRIVEERQTITQAKAIALVGAVVASVRKHVDDRETLAAISADIAGLVHQDAAGSVREASASI